MRENPKEVKKEVYDDAEKTAERLKKQRTIISNKVNQLIMDVNASLFNEEVMVLYHDTLDCLDNLVDELNKQIDDCFKFDEKDMI